MLLTATWGATGKITPKGKGKKNYVGMQIILKNIVTLAILIIPRTQ